MYRLFFTVFTFLVSLSSFSQEPPEEFITEDGFYCEVLQDESDNTPGKVIVKSLPSIEGHLVIPSIVNYTIYYDNGIYHKRYFYVVGIGEYAAGYRNENLTKVTIPSTVTQIGIEAFSHCKNLEEVELSEGLETIGDHAFSYCEKLISINLPSSVTTIGDCAFFSCTSLLNINLPNSISSIGEQVFSNCTSLQTVTWPVSTPHIPYRAFSECKNLSSIILPDNLETIGNSAFDYCALKTIQLPSNLQTIGLWTFSHCKSLESIFIPKNVCNMGEKRGYTVYEGDEETIWEVTIGNPFIGCTSLKTIKVDENNTTYDSREGCNAIIETATNTLIAGCPTTTIPDDVWYLGGYCFQYMNNMTEIDIPQNITRIGPSAFEGCKKLEEIDFHKEVEVISNNAFRHCNTLKSVEIPEGVLFIAIGAFADCENLEKVTIPSTVREIGNCAFSGYGYESDELAQLSIKLKDIYCYLQDPYAIDEGVFAYRWAATQHRYNDNYYIYDNATLHVPAGTMSKYKETEGWSRFKNITEMSSQAATGVDALPTDSVTVVATYLIDGRMTTDCSRGLRIIRKSDGQIKKVMQ